MDYEYSLFHHTRDNQPKAKCHSLKELQAVFEVPKIVSAKEEAPLFCPAKFRKGTKRSSQNVESVSMLVFDMDCGVGWADFAKQWESAGWTFWIYTTFKHVADAPRWRAVFPLLEPVPISHWEDVWTSFVKKLVKDQADPACKDAGRMYYLPCCSPQAQPQFHSVFSLGASLDASSLPKKAVKPKLEKPKAKPPEVDRAGDWFNATVSIDEILVPHGWRRTGNQGEMELWARPGKERRDDISATFGYRASVRGDRFFCFSSSVPGLPVRRLLTKFALYAYLNHQGNFREASREIAMKYLPKHPQPTLVPFNGAVTQSEVAELDEWVKHQCTDAANGERLVRLYGDQIRYVAEMREWAKWDGCRWLISHKANADLRVMAVESARQAFSEAKGFSNPMHVYKLSSWALKSQNSSHISNAIREAQALLTLSVATFDQKPWLFNCLNGTVNLISGELMPHDPTQMISQVAACPFDENGTIPVVFNRFLNRIMPDQDTLAFLLQYLGYSLTGVLSDQSYIFLHGATGNNGKSTLVDLLLWLMGDYAMTLDTESLMLTKGYAASTEYEFARLRGKRFAVAHEVSDNQRINEPLIKRLTGGDTIRARQPYGLPFEFRPMAKIAMTGNNKPTITGQDSATWRRVNLIPFEVEVPAEERDAKLGEKLRQEGPQILAWLVKWCLNYQRQGLIRSPAMLESKNLYREENDFLAEFISSECVFGDGYTVGCSEVHQRYIEWAKRTMSMPLTPTSFGRIMSQRAASLNISRARNGVGRRIWKGLDIVQR
jgi:P4 family phage/plasmid primase-like protien